MISESEKERALQILREYEEQANHNIRDSIENDCPSKDYKKGTPNGNCDSDGHYMCNECIHYNMNIKYK